MGSDPVFIGLSTYGKDGKFHNEELLPYLDSSLAESAYKMNTK
jgi:hypothetical protein